MSNKYRKKMQRIGLLIFIVSYTALPFVLYDYYIIVCIYDSHGKLFVSLLFKQTQQIN